MQTPRSTRSSVLGKRSHQPDTTPTSRTDKIVAPPTPDPTPNPKRPRTSANWVDGDGNKENVPPEMAIESPPTSARAIRALRRTNTESTPSTPSRTRTSESCMAFFSPGRLLTYRSCQPHFVDALPLRVFSSPSHPPQRFHILLFPHPHPHLRILSFLSMPALVHYFVPSATIHLNTSLDVTASVLPLTLF